MIFQTFQDDVVRRPLTHRLWTVNKNNNTTQPNKKRPLTHHWHTGCGQGIVTTTRTNLIKSAHWHMSCWTTTSCWPHHVMLNLFQHLSGYRMQNDYFRDAEQAKNQLSLCSSDFLDFSGWRVICKLRIAEQDKRCWTHHVMLNLFGYFFQNLWFCENLYLLGWVLLTPHRYFSFVHFLFFSHTPIKEKKTHRS